MTRSGIGQGWILLRDDPKRRLRRRVAFVVLWLLSLLLAAEAGRRLWPPATGELGAELHRLRAAVAESGERIEQLESRLRLAERGEEVARGALARLQGLLAQREAEVAALRADLAFFERLTAAEGERRGMSIHGLVLRPRGGDIYQVRFALAQNLETARPVRGRVWLEVEGMSDEKRRRLGWTVLRKDPAAVPLSYAFRYFQQFEEDITLPPRFRPLRLIVRWSPEGGREAEESYPWERLVQSS